MPRVAYQFLLQGAVQGRGVRPAIAQLAEQNGWCGTVRNTAEGVELRVAKDGLQPADLELRLRSLLPRLAALRIESVPDAGWTGFTIEPSTEDAGLTVPVPRDVAICTECLSETEVTGNRRFRYGLTSCTTCGPRYSVIRAMPFDRPRTSLDGFPLCPACRAEYGSSTDRRRHAQTMACPLCGPQVWASDREGRLLAEGDEAAVMAGRVLLEGRIVALRGVGGYQLLADATNGVAVDELRRRKARPAKPFAVLCRSIEAARELAKLDAVGERELLSGANPIVLAPRRIGSILVAGVSPHLRDIGLLLPTTALHARLAELTDRPLVCTSANHDGDPLAFQVEDAERVLNGIADLFLHHDREIVHPIDDSVVRPMGGTAVTLRCARGLAPLPLPLSGSPILALGAQLKSACAWSNGRQGVLGPHVGDLQGLATRDRWNEHIAAMSGLYGLADARIVADAHPDGFSRQWAQETGRDVLPVWHHHAHVVAGMVEHGWLDEQVLGIAADGTGWGPDGTLWGGEVLWATATEFRRAAHVRTFTLPGGEAAIGEIWRVAVAAAGQIEGMTPESLSQVVGLPEQVVRRVLHVSRSRLSVVTSSLGRLFDVAACLVLGLNRVSFEGEAAMRLEAVCDPAGDGEYAWDIESGDPVQLDWRSALQALLADRKRGVAAGVMAERFHRGVASWMIDVVRRLSQTSAIPSRIPVVLSGGVFQNRRLVELLVEHWPADCGLLGLPGRIPPNDGGLAAGQLAIALARGRAGRASFRKEW
ncbi:MAG TPA: carbamoyltransferase HypF [Planctomycetaceae bacterium]|nr:carbamoyltransferase HypF [Planctomycetaceae bacterium]